MSRLQRVQVPVAPVVRLDAGRWWRIRRFLGSPGHLLGTIFAIVGIVLLDSGLTSGLEGFAVVGLLYLTGYFVAARPRLTTFGAPQAKDAPRIQASLDELVAIIRMRVADDIYRRVVSIREGIVFTLDHAREQDEIDPNVYLVRQTATVYLPEVLSTYLALPRPYAERQPIEAGRTSHDILLDQLTLMDVKTRQVAEDVIRRDSQELVKHGRFLADRYQGSSLDVASGPPAAKQLPEAHSSNGKPRVV